MTSRPPLRAMQRSWRFLSEGEGGASASCFARHQIVRTLDGVKAELRVQTVRIARAQQEQRERLQVRMFKDGPSRSLDNPRPRHAGRTKTSIRYANTARS